MAKILPRDVEPKELLIYNCDQTDIAENKGPSGIEDAPPIFLEDGDGCEGDISRKKEKAKSRPKRLYRI